MTSLTNEGISAFSSHSGFVPGVLYRGESTNEQPPSNKPGSTGWSWHDTHGWVADKKLFISPADRKKTNPRHKPLPNEGPRGREAGLLESKRGGKRRKRKTKRGKKKAGKRKTKKRGKKQTKKRRRKKKRGKRKSKVRR